MPGKFCVSVTCAKDNSDKATVGFVVANAAVASDKETVVFLSTEGVRLAVKGYADGIAEEGFAPLKGRKGLSGGAPPRLSAAGCAALAPSAGGSSSKGRAWNGLVPAGPERGEAGSSAVTSAEPTAVGITSTTSMPTSRSRDASSRQAHSRSEDVIPPGSGVPVPGANAGSSTSTSTERNAGAAPTIATVRSTTSRIPDACKSCMKKLVIPCSRCHASSVSPGQ